MRCQICNRETENWQKNRYTGKYESICDRCKKSIRDVTSYYTDVDEPILVAEDDGTDVDVLTILKEIDADDSRRTN